jgi:hypothetical protein
MSPTAVRTTALSGSGATDGTVGDEGTVGEEVEAAEVGLEDPSAGSRNPQEERRSIGSSAQGIALFTHLAISLTVLTFNPFHYIFISAIKKYKKVKNRASPSQIQHLVYNRGTERISNTK